MPMNGMRQQVRFSAPRSTVRPRRDHGSMSESVVEFERLLQEYASIGERLAVMTQELAVHRVVAVLPAATTLEVTGSFNEDWLRVLRINRVLDGAREVLFDVAAGGTDAIEAVIDEVNTEYLDLLMDLTGDAYLGRHEVAVVLGGQREL